MSETNLWILTIDCNGQTDLVSVSILFVMSSFSSVDIPTLILVPTALSDPTKNLPEYLILMLSASRVYSEFEITFVSASNLDGPLKKLPALFVRSWHITSRSNGKLKVVP